MPKPLRILCTGDIHIGRRPSAVPAADSRRWSCASMWGALVEYAISQRVDLFAISGDIVDRENRFYEAYGPLERGLKRLAATGIQTVAVSGNHDFDVLPRLADAFGSEQFRLIGRDGQWERLPIQREGRTILQVDGWSFPSERVLQSPMSDYSRAVNDWRTSSSGANAAGNGSSNGNGRHDGGIPILGLLHGDLDIPASVYGPIMLADLRQHAVALWLLGHVHKPAWIAGKKGEPPVLYPGSPQAMDPGETGIHGPWMVEIGAAGVESFAQIARSKVRYDPLDIDLSSIDDEGAFKIAIPLKWNARLNAIANDNGTEEFICTRLRLFGRTRLHRNLTACCAYVRELDHQAANLSARIDQITLDTRPAIDLDELSRAGDLPGVLARLLVSLQKTSDGAEPSKEGGEVPLNADLMRQAAEMNRELYAARPYQGIAQDPLPDGAELKACVLNQGYLLLDELLAQREEA